MGEIQESSSICAANSITLGKLFCPPASVPIWINEGAEQKLTWGQEAAESLKPMGRGCLVASPLGLSLFPWPRS